MTVINNSVSGGKAPDDPMFKAQRQVKGKELTTDDFMKVFLAQIKMQDPNKPFDSSAMLQQMAQLTQLSASQELKKTIGGLNNSIAKSQVMTAAQFIGKRVQFLSGVAPLKKDEGLSGSVILDRPSNDVTITIRDDTGKVVKTIKKSSQSPGVLDFTWDGKIDGQEEPMKDGFYKISATAMYDGKAVDMPTGGTFRVDSVAMDASKGTVYLNVDGLGGMDMNMIIKIMSA